jgi:hypothetical protein
VAGALAAVALLASPALARGASHAVIWLRSGDLVVFEGTSLQCLAFGPVPVKRTPTTGVLCFKGPPRQHHGATWWMALTYQGSGLTASSTVDNPLFRAATSKTTIRRTVRVADTATGVFLEPQGGANIGCLFAVSVVVDPGKKAVSCVGEGKGWAEPYGFVLSQRRLASVTFGPNWNVVEISASWRQPRCSCDK